MDENWISLRIVRSEIARTSQVPNGIAQRRVIDAINEGVRARGIPRQDTWDWSATATVRWPTHPNPDSRLPDYTNLSPDVFASATIDWEKGTLRHPNFSGEVINIELEENDFRYLLQRADKPTNPKPDVDLGERVTRCIAWLKERQDNPGKRDPLRNSALTAIEGLTHREFDAAYRLVFKREPGRPKKRGA